MCCEACMHMPVRLTRAPTLPLAPSKPSTRAPLTNETPLPAHTTWHGVALRGMAGTHCAATTALALPYCRSTALAAGAHAPASGSAAGGARRAYGWMERPRHRQQRCRCRWRCRCSHVRCGRPCPTFVELLVEARALRGHDALHDARLWEHDRGGQAVHGQRGAHLRADVPAAHHHGLRGTTVEARTQGQGQLA